VILFLRSLLWTLLLPGMVAGFIPWRYYGISRAHLTTHPLDLLALGIIAVGIVLLATCIWEFARFGRGTLSPVDPPKELVVQGLYRYVRNPMYVSVCVIVLGEALLIRSTALLIYGLAFFVIVNLWLLVYEEPNLRSRFGESYERYTRAVGRWIPGRSPS
jgi:protein-S-isoprenylcysteine O-methyltransferase Ste14